MLTLSPRARRTLPIVALLVLSLALLVVVGARSSRAFLEMRNRHRVQTGESVGVRPWMTIPYIARTYHVPEDVLFDALGLDDNPRNRRVPLQALAARHGRDLDADIATLNATIDARRGPRPPPTPRPRP